MWRSSTKQIASCHQIFFSSSWYGLKIANLALKNNHSFNHSKKLMIFIRDKKYKIYYVDTRSIKQKSIIDKTKIHFQDRLTSSAIIISLFLCLPTNVNQTWNIKKKSLLAPSYHKNSKRYNKSVIVYTRIFLRN